jgi:hypothetical protein
MCEVNVPYTEKKKNIRREDHGVADGISTDSPPTQNQCKQLRKCSDGNQENATEV